MEFHFFTESSSKSPKGRLRAIKAGGGAEVLKIGQFSGGAIIFRARLLIFTLIYFHVILKCLEGAIFNF